jgi:hypothetical protein
MKSSETLSLTFFLSGIEMDLLFYACFLVGLVFN